MTEHTAARASAAPTIGWGLLGTGGICGRMAFALSQVADARLVAVGSRQLERSQAFAHAQRGHLPHGPVRAHGSYAALVEDPAVDVVYVGTPHPDHAPSVRLALEAGKAVLCEKPFTLNRPQALGLVALARERGLFLMEAMWTRCLPAIVEAKRLVDSGAIGEPLSVIADFGFAARLPDTHRVFDPALGGGALLDLGIYPLSLSACLLGPVEAVQAMAQRGATGVDVHLAFQARHARDRVSQGLCSLRATTGCGATVLGTTGRIEIEPQFHAAQALRVWRDAAGGASAPQVVERLERPARGDGFVPQVEEVQRCLRAGLRESPVMPLDESVALMGWMDEMRRQVGVSYPGEAR
jgi:predicted dehydrogenase